MDQSEESLPLPTNSTKVTFLFPSPLGSRKASAAGVRVKGTGRGENSCSPGILPPPPSREGSDHPDVLHPLQSRL